jgi:hypothetical protein
MGNDNLGNCSYAEGRVVICEQSRDERPESHVSEKLFNPNKIRYHARVSGFRLSILSGRGGQAF